MATGILDAATNVKMTQDARAAQADQFTRTEAEGARRFDIQQAAQAENTAWTRSQEEKKMAEDTRRFGIAQDASARGEQRAERQLDFQQFGAELNALHTASSMESQDIERQKSRMQLQQYLAATDEEKRAKANRENMAKGAFGSLVIAGRMNGGVMPMKAIELANQQLGDKENVITGGGFDENTGLAWFNVKNLKDGKEERLKMTPENQYAAIHGGIGKEEADMWRDTFKIGSSMRMGIDRERLKYQEREAFELAKQKGKLEAERNDPVKQADMLQKQADTYAKRAETATSKEDRAFYTGKAKEADQQASDLRDSVISGGKQKAKPFVITTEIQSKYGIPPAGSRTTQNPDGGYTVIWKDKGQIYEQDFAPGEW